MWWTTEEFCQGKRVNSSRRIMVEDIASVCIHHSSPGLIAERSPE